MERIDAVLHALEHPFITDAERKSLVREISVVKGIGVHCAEY